MQLLLTGAFAYTAAQIAQLETLGAEITFVQDEREKLTIDVSKFDAVVCNGLFLQNDIRAFKNLRFIQATSAGLDRMPLDFIKENGIRLCNARGVYSVPMAEFAVSGVLSLYKHTAQFLKNQKSHSWVKDRTVRELAGDTALIVGCGSVGTECAKRLRAFDMHILAADICRPTADCYDAYFPMERLSEALAAADVVVLTLPLTEDTRGMFCADLLRNCKTSAILVNLARGAVVCEADLTDALQNGTLGGAVLDVFETEPLSEESPLWDMENVLITPHNSFVSPKNNARLFQCIYENLKAFLESERAE